MAEVTVASPEATEPGSVRQSEDREADPVHIVTGNRHLDIGRFGSRAGVNGQNLHASTGRLQLFHPFTRREIEKVS